MYLYLLSYKTLLQSIVETPSIMEITLLIFAAILQGAAAQEIAKTVLSPVIIHGDGSKTCPSTDERNNALLRLKANVSNYLLSRNIVPYCGEGIWHRVAYLDMSDSSQQCPSAWREFTSDGIRACARPNSVQGSCPGTCYSVSRQYSKVCGRIIGYQFGSPAAFWKDGNVAQETIDGAYLDGISITHGNPRIHIWSYAAGSSENGSCNNAIANCPCSNGSRVPPSYYVGTNYYCESAYRGNCWISNVFFPDDPLWDGQQCDNEGTCCTGTNTPPWFSVNFPNSINDDIEVRICHNQRTSDEDTPIQLLELYVQ